MRRTLHNLNAISIGRAKAAGYHADGGGLYLQVTSGGAKSWIFRFALAGRRREMGLGPYPTVSLAKARDAATKARGMVKAGNDPITTREAERASQRLIEARAITFDQASELFLTDMEDGWKNPKHRKQWRSTLQTYVSPIIGDVSIGAVGTPEVRRVFDQLVGDGKKKLALWKARPETASRIRGRIERILDWARVRGDREGDNPARWRGHLKELYQQQGKARAVKHHAAVAIDDMPAVYSKLKASTGMAARALRFAILTAARAGEVTGATWAEINLDDAIWTISADRMKMQREHRVPLSREALALLKELAEVRSGKLVFPGQRTGRPLSIASLSKVMKAAAPDATTHGCRSTFKDWCSERTSFPSEVSEMALAHSIGDRVEAAYRRGELLKKRAAMMQQWANFLRTESTGKVVPIGQRRRAN
jgi:integrase